MDTESPGAGEPFEVADSIWRVEEELAPGIMLALHVVAAGDSSVLIDTGVKSSLPAVHRLLEAAELRPADIGLVVNTHAHHDHIGSNQSVIAESGALLAAPRGAVPWIEDHDRHLREFTAHHPHVFEPSPAELDELRDTLDGATRVDLEVGEGFTVRLGSGRELRVLELPGHIDHEIGFVEPASRTLLLADAVPRLDWSLFHGHGRPAVLRTTLRRLRGIVAADRVDRICLAHYEVMDPEDFLEVVGAAEEFVNRVDVEVRRQVREAGGEGAALADIWEGTCKTFGREREFRGLAMVVAHLDELIDGALVERAGPDRYRWIAAE